MNLVKERENENKDGISGYLAVNLKSLIAREKPWSRRTKEYHIMQCLVNQRTTVTIPRYLSKKVGR